MTTREPDPPLEITPPGPRSAGSAASPQATIAGSAHEGPGTQIGPYKVLELIGEGGFGSVFLARQETPVQRRVAVKIIKLGMQTRQVVARFEQERQALAMMDHPCIARVLDAGATDSGRPYFVMELVKGDPIVEYCDKQNLSIPGRLALFAQVCQAVQHAHTKGIIHRDIKPSNILVSDLDGQPAAKVIDFGVAKATSGQLTDKTLYTEHRALIGTPEYMSPEQAEGSMDIDTRTDVYSLGVLLYELLTGTTPFSGKDLRSAAFGEIQRIIREVDPPVPSTRISRNTDTLLGIAAKRHTEPRTLGVLIRGELDWIVMKAIEKDRQRRYETAAGLAQDIRRYLSGEAVLAAPPGAAYRVRKFVRRHKAGVAAAAIVALVLVLGLAGTAWGLRQALLARDGEAAARQQAQREAERALAAEAQTSARAEELEQVSKFQASMLSQIDPAAAGEKLVADLRERFAKALDKSALPPDQRSSRAASLSRDLSEINATDAAAAMIDRTILAPSVRAVDEKFKALPAVDASLRDTLAQMYITLGRYDDAMPLQKSALDTRRRVLGEDHPDTLISMKHVAQLLAAQGKAAEAEAMMRQTLEKRRKISGPEHPETLVMLGELGTRLREQGKLDEAEPLLKARLDISRRVLGPEHRETLIALNMYGFLLIDRGKAAEAEPLWREAYETGARVLGPDDPDVFVWTNNMGGLLGQLRRPRDAEPFYRSAFESSRRIYGEEHPQTLSCKRNLAYSLQAQGRLDEAEPVLREVLQARRRVLGEEHPSAIESLGDLGALYRDRGKFAEAEPYLREQLTKRRQILGDEHPATIAAIGGMATIMRAQGKWADAEQYNRQALEVRRRTLGDEHPDTLVSASNVCVNLMDQNKLDQAEPIARDILEKRLRVLGPDHPDTLVSNNVMSQVLQRLKRPAEAEPFLRAAYDSGLRVLGPDNPDTLIFTTNLANLLQDLGNMTEAEKLIRDAAERSARVMGPKTPMALVSKTLLGSILIEQNKPEEVLALLGPSENDARAGLVGGTARRLGVYIRALNTARARLAKTTAEFEAAEAGLLEAQPMFVKPGAEKSKETLACERALAELYAAWEKAEPGKGYAAKSAAWAEEK